MMTRHEGVSFTHVRVHVWWSPSRRVHIPLLTSATDCDITRNPRIVAVFFGLHIKQTFAHQGVSDLRLPITEVSPELLLLAAS
jgi:hypothetical protein